MQSFKSILKLMPDNLLALEMFKKALLVLLCLMATAYSLCPANCTTCSTSTTCSACQAGSFLVNNTFCPTCPQGCSACRQGVDGRPVCTACVAPAQLGGNGQCFLCDPSCSTCAVTPRNCTACRDGQELRTVNFTGSCGAITGCPIPNCGQCAAPDAQNMTFCQRCLPGYFPFRQSCFPCKYPCANCIWDGATVWTVVSGFWDQSIRRALNITGVPANGTLPPFLNNLNFGSIPEEQKRGWVQAFLVTKVAAPVFPNPQALIGLIPQNVQFLASIQNLSGADMENAILRKINQVLNKTWSLNDYYNRTAQAAADMTLCAECGAGFQNTSATECERCPRGCSNCTAGACTDCQPGFRLNNAGGVCDPCTPPCATCSSSATTCTACVPPASLVGSACVLCQEPCATCSAGNTSACTTCKRPFSLTANAGTCFRCDQDLCIECQPTNASVCLQCRPGATLVDGRCQMCPSNCSSCSTTVPPVCFDCLTGFKLVTVDNQTRCLACGPGCIRCADTACLECQPGSFLNPTNATCQRCKQGCKECTALETCTSFSSGVVIISGNVVTCRPGCKVCDTASPDVCTECEERYFLDTDVCRPCEPGCAACSSPTVCTRCVANLILANDNCTKCAGNCRTCDSGNTSSCLTCKRGFTLVGNDCVNQCERGCLQCDPTNSSICIKCAQAHALRPDGRCVKCLGRCSGSCDPRNISICLTCVDGFELKDNQCVRCQEGCATCLNGECSLCVPGFTLSQSSTGSFVCVEKCRPPCAVCSKGVCSACEAGFTFSNGNCNPDLACNPVCQFCPIGTYKNSTSFCVPCPADCATCPGGVCAECRKGFWLNNTSCQRCSPQCRTCYNNDSCEECSPGFTKQIETMTTSLADATFSDKCIPCSSNCKECAVEPDRCTSCPEGSRLFSYRCAGMFTVQYTYEINIPYSTFLENSESENFIQTISNTTNVNSSDNYINFVREGSTVVGGTISTSSQAQASTVQSGLGNSLAGYNILSSSASVYYGDSQYVEPEEEKVQTKAAANVGLIVGVVVGGVALIAIVSFLIWKFKCNKAQAINQEEGSDIVLKEPTKY